ncbi:MAG: hypothetical protein ACK4S2_15330 [Gemmobacter sp.]|uniref:hypothetical protein n=1 Tax=Gemmobacter sp. TaxID=1898957 RepID=UPI00391B91F3
MADSRIAVQRGSDLLVDLTIEDASGAAVNPTGASVAIRGATDPALASALSVSVKSLPRPGWCA